MQNKYKGVKIMLKIKYLLLIVLLCLFGMLYGSNNFKVNNRIVSTPILESSKALIPPTNEQMYQKAVTSLKNSNKIVAYGLFARLGDYKDSKKQAENLRYVLYYNPVSCGGQIYIKSNGKIGYDKNSIYAGYHNVLDNWSNIISFSFGGDSGFGTIGIKKDGTLALFGQEDDHVSNPSRFYSDLSKWTDIVQVIGSPDKYLGLKKNGSIVVSPQDKDILDIYVNWKDIIQLSLSGM
jgi:hypothetical protein